jgi:hypothetical protein
MKYEPTESRPGQELDHNAATDQSPAPDIDPRLADLAHIVVTDLGTTTFATGIAEQQLKQEAPDLELSDTPDLSDSRHEVAVSDTGMPEGLSLQAGIVSPPVARDAFVEHDQPRQPQEPEAVERDQPVTPAAAWGSSTVVAKVTSSDTASPETTKADQLPSPVSDQQSARAENAKPTFDESGKQQRGETSSMNLPVGRLALGSVNERGAAPPPDISANSANTQSAQDSRPTKPAVPTRNSVTNVPDTDTAVRDESSGLLKNSLPASTDGAQAAVTERNADSFQDVPDLPVNTDEQRESSDLSAPSREGFYTAGEVIGSLDGSSTAFYSQAVNTGNLLVVRLGVPEDSRELFELSNRGEESYRRLPEPYIRAVWDFQQRTGIQRFVSAADIYASTFEGQNLAWGVKAEHLDKIQAFAEQHGGYLTVNEAATLTGLSRGALRERGYFESVSSMRRQNSLGVRPQVVVDTMRWEHRAFASDRITPQPLEFCGMDEAIKLLQYSKQHTNDLMTELGAIPAWQFAADNSKYHCSVSYVQQLARYHHAHRQLNLQQAATAFAQQNPQLHTILRGQFESYVDHLASQNDGYIGTPQAAELLDVQKRTLWRVYGAQPDERGRTPAHLLGSIRWSFPRVTDYDAIWPSK